MSSFLDPVELSLASKGHRFINFIIDGIVYYFVQMFAILPFFSYIFIQNAHQINAQNPSQFGILYFISMITGFIVFVLYMTFQEFLLKGKTLGKFATDTKVVLLDGSEPGLKDYFMRSLCRCIPFEAFSFFGNLGWHDSLSKTRVVKNSEFMLNKIKFNEINQIGKEAE